MHDVILNQEPNHSQRPSPQKKTLTSHTGAYLRWRFHPDPCVPCVQSCSGDTWSVFVYSRTECVACWSLKCQMLLETLPRAAVFKKDRSPETDLIDSRTLPALRAHFRTQKNIDFHHQGKWWEAYSKRKHRKPVIFSSQQCHCWLDSKVYVQTKNLQ